MACIVIQNILRKESLSLHREPASWNQLELRSSLGELPYLIIILCVSLSNLIHPLWLEGVFSRGQLLAVESADSTHSLASRAASRGWRQGWTQWDGVLTVKRSVLLRADTFPRPTVHFLITWCSSANGRTGGLNSQLFYSQLRLHSWWVGPRDDCLALSLSPEENHIMFRSTHSSSSELNRGWIKYLSNSMVACWISRSRTYSMAWLASHVR